MPSSSSYPGIGNDGSMACRAKSSLSLYVISGWSLLLKQQKMKERPPPRPPPPRFRGAMAVRCVWLVGVGWVGRLLQGLFTASSTSECGLRQRVLWTQRRDSISFQPQRKNWHSLISGHVFYQIDEKQKIWRPLNIHLNGTKSIFSVLEDTKPIKALSFPHL